MIPMDFGPCSLHWIGLRCFFQTAAPERTQPTCRLWFVFASTFGDGSTLKESVFVAWKFQGFSLQNRVEISEMKLGESGGICMFFFAKFWHAHTQMQDQDMCKLSTWVIILCKSDNQAIMVEVCWCKTWRICFSEVIEHSPEKYLICQWLDFPSKIILTFLNTNKNMWTLEHLRKDLFTLNFEPEIIQENHYFGQDDSTM